MEEVVNSALELPRLLRRDAEARLRDVAFDQRHPLAIVAPECFEILNGFRRWIVNEDVDKPVAPLQQAPHETFADETGPAGDERAHEPSSPLSFFPFSG